MQVFYAPLRALEQQFVSYTSSLKPGPGKAVLVLCPSGRVAAHLQQLILQQQSVFSNVEFKTFSQLAATLDAQSETKQLPLLPDDGLHDYLLKNLLLQPQNNRYKISRGLVDALKSSLRDMADSLADPDTLDEYLQTLTDPFLTEEAEHMQWLNSVYRAYMEQMSQVKGYRSYQQYFSHVLHQTENSAYLKNFSHIIVYGFYELTGRQLELFHALKAYEPLTVFWVYANHAAFAFGRKFFESNLLGASEVKALPSPSDTTEFSEVLNCLFSDKVAAQKPENLHFISAPDEKGELFFVAKQMQYLHEKQGIAFSDMAIVARNAQAYQHLLEDICADNFIALNTSFSHKLTELPLGVFIFNLLSLARGGFERSAVLSVVNSAFFKRNNQWRYLIEKCLAERDFAQWEQLLRPSLPYYDVAFLEWLRKIKAQLEFLEKPLSWKVLVQGVEDLLREQVQLEILSPSEKKVWDAVMQVLRSMLRYEFICPNAREKEFLEELFSAMEKTSLTQGTDMPCGVQFLDVMSLRGLSFKVVFILGMNEKVFPQLVREDPLLKDQYRRVLRDRLGFWINQKMERLEEERLLFFCALEAAQEQCYLSYLRVNAEGKPLVPSSYLVEAARAAQIDLEGPEVKRISGRMLERFKNIPLEDLNKKELSLLLTACNVDIDIQEKAGLLSAQDKTSLQVCAKLSSMGGLNDSDGWVRKGESIFSKQNMSGFSPSALQELACCPMKYFFSKGVGLKEKEDVLDRSSLAPNLRGTVYHEILMDYYQGLYQQGLTGELFESALTDRLEKSVCKFYNRQSYKEFGIYPVIWELILQDIQEKLSAFVVKDAQNLQGYIPSVFETLFEGMYAPSEDIKVKLKGIIDRIDINPQTKTFKIVDYKSGKHGGKDLASDMFKYVILQPFIYLLLAQQAEPTQHLSADGACLLSINKGYARQELSQIGFEQVSQRAHSFFVLIFEIIKQGRFFISPGAHCEFCSYSAICRKDAFRSLLRAKLSKDFQRLEEAKQ